MPFEAGRRAVQAHYERTGIRAEVFKGEYLGLYRTKFIRDHDPLISIIIPNKDHIDDLKRCMESIEQKSTYKNYEYIIVENNSTDSATFEYYKKLEAENPKVRMVYSEKEISTYTDAVRAVLEGMEIDPDVRNILVAHQFVAGAVQCESEESFHPGDSTRWMSPFWRD